MSKAYEARICCSSEVRDLVAAQKRGGQNYDTLLREMVRQYDPEEAGGRFQD